MIGRHDQDQRLRVGLMSEIRRRRHGCGGVARCRLKDDRRRRCNVAQLFGDKEAVLAVRHHHQAFEPFAIGDAKRGFLKQRA